MNQNLLNLKCNKLFFFLFLIWGPYGFSQTYTGDLALVNQAQIDAFNYTEVTGNLYVFYGADIVNVLGLSELETIGGLFEISNNHLLTNIDALTNLSFVGGSMVIWYNNTLESISGFQNLNNVVGGFQISDNPVLESIGELTGVFEGNYLVIRNNNNLTDLSGLSGLTGVGAPFYIDNNDILGNLDGLEGITYTDQEIYIASNISLQNVDGLSNLNSVGTNLTINGNDALSNCCGISQLLEPGAIGGYTNISNNQTGCDSPMEVVDADCVVASAVPTMSQWGLIMLSLILLIFGTVTMKALQSRKVYL